MEILEQQTFLQPTGDRIVLRRMKTPYYPAYSCERLVGGQVQEGWYGWELKTTCMIMQVWNDFETKIKSIRLIEKADEN